MDSRRKEINLSPLSFSSAYSLSLSMRYTVLKAWHASSHHTDSENEAKQNQINLKDGKKERSPALLDSNMPEVPLDSHFLKPVWVGFVTFETKNILTHELTLLVSPRNRVCFSQ